MLADNPATRIRILGVNSFEASGGNPLMVDGRDLPWLQDTLEELAWADWNAQVDDVIICDLENRIVRVYNLLTHTLSDPANVDELVGILKGLAGE